MIETGKLLSLAAIDYHDSEGVSATMLDQIRITPAHLQAYLAGELKEESDALSLGTLCHRAIFEPDTLTDESVTIQPETIWIEQERAAKLSSVVAVLNDAGNKVVDGTKLLVQWNNKISECGNWVKENSKLPIVDSRDWRKAVRIRDNAHKDDTVKRLLKGGFCEQGLWVEDEHGTLRRSRYDYISTAGNGIPDVKTCRSAHPDKFEKAIDNYFLYVRAAFYIDNANLAGMQKEIFTFIAIETSPPFLVACYQLNDLVLEAGRKLYKRDLQLYRNCMESGKWPGYHEGIMEIGLPEYSFKRLMAEGMA